MGQKQMLVGFAALSIFVIAFINFIIGFSNDNSGSSLNISEDISYRTIVSDINSSSVSYLTAANSSTQSLYESPTTGSEGIDTKVGGFKFGAGEQKDGWQDILSASYSSLFGKDGDFGVIYSIIIASILIILGLYVYKTLKAGAPD